MVNMAKTRPLKFILLIFGLLLIYIVSGTDLLSIPVSGQGAAGAIQYMHIDVPTRVDIDASFEVKIGLVDQAGNPVNNRTYGQQFGQFFIPSDGIKNIDGQSVRFFVDETKVNEEEDQNGEGMGIYKVPVTVREWPQSESPLYIVEAFYVGDGGSSADQASDISYRLRANSSFTLGKDGEEHIIKYAPVEVNKVNLKVPDRQPGQPEPAPVTNTVTFRVKLVGQIRDQETGTRKLSGRAATSEEITKWLEPRAFDNSGNPLKIKYEEIKEDEVELFGQRKGQKRGTGIYRVKVSIESPWSLAGKRAVLTIGRQEGGIAQMMSATVNFTTSDEEQAVRNPFFGNPYIINPPHTPGVDEIGFFGLLSGGDTVELADIDDYPTNGSFIISADGEVTAVLGMRLRVLVSDPDMIDLNASEFFQQASQPAPAEYGTGTAMVAEDGAFDSSEEMVVYDISSATIDGMAEEQHKHWAHGKNVSEVWGTFGSCWLSVDRTAPSVLATAPVTDEYVGPSYRTEGDSAWNNAGGTYRAAMNSVQVYEEGTLDFTEVAENDSGRGGVNFSKWFYVWDTTFTSGEEYDYKARALDGAANYSPVDTVTCVIDNTKPKADITSPAEGVGFDNTVTTTVDIVGSAYDPDSEPFGDETFDYYEVEWASGIKIFGQPGYSTGWTQFATSSTPQNPGTLAIWDISDTGTFTPGDYTIRVTSYDLAGNENLDRNGDPNTNRIYVHIDTDTDYPTTTIDPPISDGVDDWYAKTIWGSAMDDYAGVNKVEVLVKRNDTNQYWTGSGWQGTEPADWPDATITSGQGETSADWEYLITAGDLPGGTSITVRAKTTDDVIPTGHTGPEAASYTAKFDPDNPTSTAIPGPNGLNNWFKESEPEIDIEAIDPVSGSGMDEGKVWYVWTTISVGTAPSSGYTEVDYTTDPIDVSGPDIGTGPDGEGKYVIDPGQTTIPEGRYRLWYRARDLARNTETTHYTDIKVDTTPPPTPSMNAESAYTEGTTNPVSWGGVTDTNPDSSTCTYWSQADTENTFAAPLQDETGWISSTNNTYAGLQDAQIYYYRVKSRDYAGNESSSWSNTVSSTQDDLAPVVNQSGPTPQTWYNSDQTVSVWVTDTSVGPRGFRWAWDSDPGNNWNSMSVWWSATGNTSFPGAGQRTLYVYGYDNIISYDHRSNYEPKHRSNPVVTYEFWYDPYAPYNWQSFDFTPEFNGWSVDQTPDASITIQDDIAVADAISGLDTSTAEYAYSTDGGTGWSAWTNSGVNVTGYTDPDDIATINVTSIPFNQDSPDQNQIKFRIADNAGSLVESSAYTVPVDSVAPTVTVEVPTDGAPPPIVSPSTLITATFDDNMYESSIDGASFTLEWDNGGSWDPVAGSVSYDDGQKKATFTPLSSLTPSVIYRATVTTDVQDRAGNNLDQDPGTGGNQQYQWSFTVTDVNAEIYWPTADIKVYGTVPVHGLASGTDAQYYKVEYEDSSNPGVWNSIKTDTATSVESGIWSQTDWQGGSGQLAWSDDTKYYSGTNVDTTSVPGTVRLSRSGTWYNNNWVARKKITVSNPNASALADYQVKVDIPYAADMKSDFGDLRFTDSDGTTLLSYWMESYTASTSATIWIKVPALSASSSRILYIYYGNTGATSLSSVSDTFLNNQIYLRSWAKGYATWSQYMDNHSEFDSNVARIGHYNYGVYGTGYVTQVDHTSNPYGSNDRYSTQYKFLFVPTVSGSYKIGTNSADGSEILRNDYDTDINHTVIVSWYGNHGEAPSIDDHSAFYSLDAGEPVWFEYRQSEYTGSQKQQMGIMVPGQAWQTVNTTNFSGQLFARKYTDAEPTVSIEDDSYYDTSGTLVSSVYDAGSAVTWGAVTWDETLYSGTDVTVQIRAGDNPDPDLGTWTDWSYPRSVSSGDLIPLTVSPNQYIQYRLNLYGDSTGAKTPVISNITLYDTSLADWDTTAVSDGTYTIRLSTTVSSDADPLIRWSSDNVLVDTVVVDVENDANNDEPDSDIVLPTNGSFVKGTQTISGTATDDFPGIGKVELRIQRGSDSQYWNGGGWQADEIWVETTSSGSETSTFTYEMTGFQNGLTYTVDSKATDKANKAETTFDTITVTGDSTDPTASITYPADNDYLSAPSVSITGAASDANLSEYKVEYQLDGDSDWSLIGTTHDTSPGSPSIWAQTSDAEFNTGSYDQTMVQDSGTNGSVVLGNVPPATGYPSSSTQDTKFNAQGILTSGRYSRTGVGVVTTDGSYLYVKRSGGYEGPLAFTKIGSGYGGTTAGVNYGELPSGINASSVSAFYYDGYIYNGYTTSGLNLQRQNVATGVVDYVTLPSRLVNRANGADITGVTTEVMVTSDGRYAYSIGKSGSAWKVKIYDPQDSWNLVSQFTTTMEGTSSYYTAGFVADGSYIYPVEAIWGYHGYPYYANGYWPSNSSRVTRIGTGLNGTTSGELVSQWYLNAGTTFVINGQYDPTNLKVWMGIMGKGTTTTTYIYRYSASNEYETSGTFTSGVFDAGSTVTWGDISWTESGSGTITIETRSGDVVTPDSSWSAWATEASGTGVSSPDDRFIQYKATFSGPGSTSTPSLDDIQIEFSSGDDLLEVWPISDLVDGEYSLKLTATDMAGNVTTDTSDPVYIDTQSPQSILDVLLNLDGKDTGYVAGTNVDLTGTASDANIDTWVVEREREDSPGTWVTINSGSSSITASDLGSDWNTTGLDSTFYYTIRLRTTDKATNVTQATRAVYVDNTAPTITLTIPVDTDTNIDPRTHVTAYFDDRMDGDTLESPATNFTLANGGSVSPSEVTYVDQAGSSYSTFKPAVLLSMDTLYTASLSVSVKNRAGVPLASQYDWTFTTSKVEGDMYLPLSDSYISGEFPVMGRATGTQFGEYKLEYQSGRHDADEAAGWTQIGSDQGTAVTSQRGVQTDWSGGVDSGTVAFGTTTDKYSAKDTNVVTDSGYSRLGSSSIKWLAGAWDKRKVITIDNTGSADTLTDYQVELSVSYVAEMKADFSDLRFTDSDGQTKLKYWVEKYTDSSTATVWVKIPSIPAAETKTVYMYYGNTGASGEDDPDNTFIFFDEFTNSTIDVSKWDTGQAVGFLQAGSQEKLYGTTTSGRLTSQTQFSYPSVLEVKTRTTYRPANGVMVGGFFASTADCFGLLSNGSSDYYRNNSTWINIGNRIGEVQDGDNAWYKLTIEARTSSKTRYKIVNMSTSSTTRDELIFNGVENERIALGERYDNSYTGQPYSNSWDYVYVREYAAAAPGVAFESSEDYESSGSLTSVVFDGGSVQDWKLISWTENVPKGANITVQTRTGDTSTPDGSWTGWSTASNYAPGTLIPAGQSGKRYIQYRTNFYGNGATLLDVTIWHSPLIDWDTTSLSDGLYTLRLVVTDADDDWSDSHVQREAVVVNVDNTDPTVNISSPIADALLTNMVTVSGTANDDRASVGKVEVKIDSSEWYIAVGSSRVNQDDSSAVYTGAWTTALGPEPSDGTLVYADASGSSVTYSFNGTSINVISTRGPDRGKARITVDSDPAVDIDLYNSDQLYQQIVFSEGGLSAGPHTIQIDVLQEANPSATGTRVDIDAFEVGGTIDWTYDWVTNLLADGPHTVTVRATDRAGNTSTEQSRNVTTDNTDPVSAITAPAADSAFTTDTDVVGTASDTNFDRYELKYGYGSDPDDWVDIGTYTPAAPGVSSDTLGTWLAPDKTPLFEWVTVGDSQDWSPVQQITNLDVDNGYLSGQTTGTDGYLKSSPSLSINANDVKVLKLRMKVTDASSVGKIYWKYSYPKWSQYSTVSGVILPLGEPITSTKEDEWGRPQGTGAGYFSDSRRMLSWPLANAGQWVEYSIDMATGRVWADDTMVVDYSQGSTGWPNAGYWAGTVYQLRIDPTSDSGVDFEIDYLSVEGADGNYKIELTTYDDVGRSSQASVDPIIIDRFNPACSITSPVNMSFIGSGSFTASGKSVDDPVNGVASGVDKVQLRTIENVDSFAPTVGPWLDATGTTDWSKDVSLPAGWHGLEAKAIDKAGNEQTSNLVYVTVDTAPPPRPRLRAMPAPDLGGVMLSWTPVKDDGSGVDYYVLYRGNTPVTTGVKYPDGKLIDQADSELVVKDFGSGDETFRAFHASNAIDTDYTPNTTLRYYVRAVDQVGNYSAKASASVVYDTQPPTEPTNLAVAQAGSTNAATLLWTASDDNQAVAEYRIYRDTTQGFTPSDEKLIGNAQVIGTFFTTKFYDPDLVWGETYYYKVVTYDDSQNPSAVSNEASFTVGSEQDFSDLLPHLTFSENADQCVLCHRTHTGPGENLMQREYESETCFTCHDGTGSNVATKAQFDYAPSGLHRIKDDLWPTGALACIDCHNPHLNTENASFDNFDDTPVGEQPLGWTYASGAWAAVGDATYIKLRQSSASGQTLATKDTGIDIASNGGFFSTQITFVSGAEAYFTVAGDGSTPRRGVTISLNDATNKMELRDGATVYRSTDVSLTSGEIYRITIRLDTDRNLRARLYEVVKGDLVSGHDTVTDDYLASIDYLVPVGAYNGSYLGIGTNSATTDFDVVRVNTPGMLQTRYRGFYQSGSELEYRVPDDRVLTEAFCLSCHGSSADSPGGSQTQYYTSVHNPLMGGMNDQVLDQDNTNQVKTNPASLTPRWQEIREEWRDIKTNPAYIMPDGNTIGSKLGETANACLYCHDYHGQQFYDRTQGGEEELCYTCHGGTANFSRDGWNVKEQYQKQSVHGLTMDDANIKCTSCHGQRAMTDRHVYDGAMTSMITNPKNIKQYWSDMRSQGKTLNDYCNVCHTEADRKGRVLIETHTSSKIIPYTVKYPPLITTNTANGFNRSGYTLGDAYTNQETYPAVNAQLPVNWLTDNDASYDEGSAIYSTTTDSYVEFTFDGSSVALVSKLDADRGIAQIFVDGARVTNGDTQLPGDAGVDKSGVDLFSSSAQWQQTVYEKRGLDPTATHTIRIIVTDQKNAFSTGYRIDVDSFNFTVPRVGHYLYAPSDGNCAGTCHEDAGLPDYIVDSQEAKTKITCMTCHHPHGTDADRLVHQHEDYKVGETVIKGQCLHCHDGSVTQ